MVNIFEDLKELNIPVYAEGDAPELLPDEYFTISEDYSSTTISADNEPKQYSFEFNLKWYTKDLNRLYTGLNEAIALLRNKNYIIDGLGYTNETYQNTWYSRQVDLEKLEDL